MNGGDFLYLSAPRSPGVPFVGDLQAWIHSSHLAPDWLRIGTDIIGADPGAAAPTFNMTFSLAGNTVPGAGISGEPNCHGDSISAMSHTVWGIHPAAATRDSPAWTRYRIPLRSFAVLARALATQFFCDAIRDRGPESRARPRSRHREKPRING